MEVSDPGVEEGLQPRESFDGYGRMVRQHERRSLGLSHPSLHVGVRPVGENNKILDIGLVPSCFHDRQGSAGQGMEAVSDLDGRNMSIMSLTRPVSEKPIWPSLWASRR